jgi:fatty acid desaturase
MARRDPREARTLGLWTAAWLAVLLLAGLLWLGDLSLQWPVLLVPLLWALFALRPRPHDRGRAGGWQDLPAPGRTDTVERPLIRDRPDRRR